MTQPAALHVNFASAHYTVYIGAGLLHDSELLQQQVCKNQALVVTNETIAPLYLDVVKSAFANIQCDVVVLPDGEAYKDQTHLNAIYDALFDHHHQRDTTLFALGGGVIGDITGFAAATYQRGVRLVHLPTTLLAQVDASLGGKTAINMPQGKNMIGSFYQPHAVIMDLTTLETLPTRMYRAGFAEVIKYALLAGEPFIHALQSWMVNPTESLQHLIIASLEVKKAHVCADERDQGCRMLLNLGHTFAHALETIGNYQRFLHGEAVAIGLYCASLLSQNLGYLNETDVALVKALIKQAGLPYAIPADIDLYSLEKVMQRDKKNQGGALTFVLIRAFGDCIVEKNITSTALQTTLSMAQHA